MLNEVFAVSATKLQEMIFGHDSDFMAAFFRERRHVDGQYAQWATKEGGLESREVTYNFPVKIPLFSRPSTPAFETHTYIKKEPR